MLFYSIIFDSKFVTSGYGKVYGVISHKYTNFQDSHIFNTRWISQIIADFAISMLLSGLQLGMDLFGYGCSSTQR